MSKTEPKKKGHPAGWSKEEQLNRAEAEACTIGAVGGAVRPAWEGGPLEHDPHHRLRCAVMEADREYQAAGESGTRAWLYDFLIPAMQRNRIKIVLDDEEPRR